MTTLSAVLEPVRYTRSCKWCGHWVTEHGRHRADGSFDAWSVLVTEAEIDLAIKRAAVFRHRSVVRYNIALGKHSGTYEPD